MGLEKDVHASYVGTKPRKDKGHKCQKKSHEVYRRVSKDTEKKKVHH